MSLLPDQAGAEEVLLTHLPAEDLTAEGAENFNKINYKKEICKNISFFIYRLKSVEYAKRTKHKTTRYAGEEIEVVQKNTNPI